VTVFRRAPKLSWQSAVEVRVPSRRIQCVISVNRKWHEDIFRSKYPSNCGPGSVVCIATGYGLDGPGIESRCGLDFPHMSRPALWPTQPPVQWVPGLPGGKERPGRDADPSPLLVPWGRTVELYLYSLYGPYGLYRASAPVEGCTLPFFTPAFLCHYPSHQWAG